MQSKFSLSTALALSIFLGGVTLAIFSPKELYLGLSWGLGVLAVLGACILGVGSFRNIKLISSSLSIAKRPPFPFSLFAWQLGMFLLTFISFSLVITQSQCITRL